MKISMKQFLAAAVFTAMTAGAAHYAQAKYTDPVWEMRRTLNMSFGQHRIALEAPLGMCFLDESQYMEQAVIKQLRAMGQDSGDGLLMAVFVECDQIEKLGQLPQMAAEAEAMPGVDPPTADFDNRGMITWLAPKLGKAPLNLQEYLDMRAPAFVDDVKKNLTKGYKKYGSSQNIKMTDNVSANLLSAAPDQYRFDEQVNRTEHGVSVGYSSEFVSEYTPRKQFGAVGTTMLRHFPVQVTFTENGKGLAKSAQQLHATLQTYLAQIATLNP